MHAHGVKARPGTVFHPFKNSRKEFFAAVDVLQLVTDAVVIGLVWLKHLLLLGRLALSVVIWTASLDLQIEAR